MTLKWKCEKSGCYLEFLPDWSMLDGCFGDTNVKVSDMDGWVYQNDALLVLEKKFRKAGEAKEGAIDQPQMRMIKSQVAKGNSFIVIWCSRPDGADISKMRVFGIEGYNSEYRLDATLADFRAAVSKWWRTHYERGKL